MIPDKWQVRLIQLLAVPGLLVAFYLLLYHNGALVSACKVGGWEDCGQVSGPNAPYASLGPIPVALIGLVGYAALFLATWLPAWPRTSARSASLTASLLSRHSVMTGPRSTRWPRPTLHCWRS